MRPAAFAAALLAFASGHAPASGGEMFSPLLERQLLTEIGGDCGRTHPDMAAEVERVRGAWLEKNQVALGQYDARFEALSPDERKANLDRFGQVTAAWRQRFVKEEAVGNGVVACTNLLVRYDADAPVPLLVVEAAPAPVAPEAVVAPVAAAVAAPEAARVTEAPAAPEAVAAPETPAAPEAPAAPETATAPQAPVAPEAAPVAVPEKQG